MTATVGEPADPAVSVIIHFLNAARYLPAAARSVQWQTYPDWELILVDGGSTDQSVPIAREIQSSLPGRVRVLEHRGPETLGIFSSRIWGAREARAPILAHLDSDDEWHPQFLERQLAAHEAHFRSRPGLTYCPMVYWWEEPERAFEAHVQPIVTPGLHEAPSLVIPFIDNSYSRTPGNSAVVVSREIVLAAAELIGTADEGIGDDQFLWSFVALNYPICAQPEPLCRYRQWPGSTCAQGVAVGEHVDARSRHLNWLAKYVTSNYKGGDRDQLIREVERLRTDRVW